VLISVLTVSYEEKPDGSTRQGSTVLGLSADADPAEVEAQYEELQSFRSPAGYRRRLPGAASEAADSLARLRRRWGWHGRRTAADGRDSMKTKFRGEWDEADDEAETPTVRSMG
jgi:hypothetical protein